MRYLALGDSISIDKWTGVAGGGAASQLALKLGTSGDRFQDLTRDGNVTEGVLADLDRVTIRPDLTTLTVGGNDFLIDRDADRILERIRGICGRLTRLGGRVILSNVYDPTDGDDRLGAAMGIDPSRRAEYRRMNDGIAELARGHGFLLADLETLFRGNGLAASQPWIHHQIEPNYTGATAVASYWLGLYRGSSGAA